MNYYSGTKNLGENPEPVLDNEVRLAISTALEVGIFIRGASEINKLAKEFGLLRAVIEGKFIEKVASQSGRTTVIIEITMEEASVLASYIQYHWGDDLPPYKEPTTLGTQPIRPDEISENMAEYIYQELITALERQLLKVIY